MKKSLLIVTAAVLAAVAGENAMAGGTPVPPAAIHLQVVGGHFLVSWTKSPDDPATVTGYEVVRGNFIGGPFTTVCKVPKGSTSCMDSTARPESIYFFKVRAESSEGSSAWSREATGEIPATLR